MATRHDFTRAVLSTLAKRCGYRCSNPGCRRETSGPGLNPDSTVNIGVGAHITAAAPGGPRYDTSLTKEQRSSAGNGIWLCQTCSTLIDKDDPRFPICLLAGWKVAAEAYARSLIDSPARPERNNEPVLELRATDPAKAWLAFSSRSTKFVGREREQELLIEFLDSPAKFSWLLLTGSGGSGKSRLALELCYDSQPGWNAGFFSRPTAPFLWTHFRPSRRTVIVIDYVANRAAEASDIVLSLNRAAAYIPYPVRILLVERDLSSWWSKFRREESLSERAEIEACAHSDPIRLEALDGAAMVKLAAEVVLSLKRKWSAEKAFKFLQRLSAIDPGGRPLFLMMAAEFLDTTDDSIVSADLLRHVLQKEEARRKSLILDPDRLKQMENLLLVSTAVGGLLPRADGFKHLTSSESAALLPDADLLDETVYSEFCGSVAGGYSLQGLQPDILGERHLLDQLSLPGRGGALAKRLLQAAWQFQPSDYAVVALRTFTDFPSDPAQHILFDLPLDAPEARLAWSELVCDLVLISGRSNDPFAQKQLAKLREVADSFGQDRAVQLSLARADFNLGHILHFDEGDYFSAEARFRAAIERAGPGTLVTVMAEHGLGLILTKIGGDPHSAIQAMSAIIDFPEAKEEQLAAALNNRADIHAELGNHDLAIADRTRVLTISGTSHDRRFIALFRRCLSLLAKGEPDAALADLDVILKTPDITPHQKGDAQLERARILLALGKRDDAINDLKSVCSAPLLFPGRRAMALVEWASICRCQGDRVNSVQLLIFAEQDPEAFPETLVDVVIGNALLAEEAGDFVTATNLWRGVVGHHDASSQQIKLAWDHLDQDHAN